MVVTKNKKGNLFIISAPSGTGKTTLCQALRDNFKEIRFSISYTTRQPRPNEKEGMDYYFITVDDFRNRLAKDEWVEWAFVHGNYYGTSSKNLIAAIDQGNSILLDIDVQGAAQVLKKYSQCIPIFIKPPSMEELKNRLLKRGTESIEVIEKRLKNAEQEMQHLSIYQHIITNDDLEVAKKELLGLIGSYL